MKLVHFLPHLIPHLVILDSPKGHLNGLQQEMHFSTKLDAILNNPDFCTGIAGDMIIRGEQPNGSDHNKHQAEFLQITRKHHLKLNTDVLQYKTKYASFFGTTFISDGHKPGNENVQAIN